MINLLFCLCDTAVLAASGKVRTEDADTPMGKADNLLKVRDKTSHPLNVIRWRRGRGKEGSEVVLMCIVQDFFVPSFFICHTLPILLSFSHLPFPIPSATPVKITLSPPLSLLSSQEICRHKEAWPFLKPVDAKKVPDYYQLIHNPMDFQTIREKLSQTVDYEDHLSVSL